MMKNKIVKIISLIAVCFAIAFSSPLGNAVFADEATSISSSEDFMKINNSSGNYVLTQDITLTSENQIALFSGSLDGNGYTITVDGLFSIFELLNNANVYNLKIVYAKQEGDSTLKTSNHFGLLAMEMRGSNIYSIESDLSVKKVVEDETSYTEISSEELSTDSSVSIGGLFGKSSGGQVYNSIILTNLNLKQTNKDSSYTYLGGVVGYSENTKFYNNTVNSVLSLNHAETEYVTTLAAGGIAGYVTGNGTYLINSVVDGSITGGVNSKLGAFAGSNSSLASQMPNPDTLQVKGLVSVITNQIEGFGENNFYTKDTHYKLAQKKVDYQKIDIYNSTDFWNVSYGWNTDSVWQEGTKAFTTGETDNRYLVILQCFESFIIYTDDNSNSHSLTSFPDENILTLDIVANDASLLSQEDNSAEIHYGESFKIKATFNDIMNGEEKVTNQDGENIKYDVFFDVVSLRLENKKISNVEFDEETLTWTIPFMKYSYKGTYAVELVKKTYNLYATTVTQDGDLQGKITGSRNSSYTYEELAYEFSYGTSITFYSVAERYFASAGFDFYPSKDRENASGKEMDIEKPKHITLDTCNESMFTFTFTENDVFTLEYLFKNADFSNQGVTIGYVNSVFSNNVCELYFEFELDGEIVDDMFGMRIYVAGEQLSKTNGVLVKKVIKGSDVTISLAGFPDEEYEFITIADDFGNEYLIDGETTFEFNSSDLETVVFTLQLKSLQDNKGNGQIWWIIGGVAGGIAAIAICWILIVKFRDNSYRNMYNKF